MVRFTSRRSRAQVARSGLSPGPNQPNRFGMTVGELTLGVTLFLAGACLLCCLRTLSNVLSRQLAIEELSAACMDLRQQYDARLTELRNRARESETKVKPRLPRLAGTDEVNLDSNDEPTLAEAA